MNTTEIKAIKKTDAELPSQFAMYYWEVYQKMEENQFQGHQQTTKLMTARNSTSLFYLLIEMHYNLPETIRI